MNTHLLDSSKPIVIQAYNPIHTYKDRVMSNAKPGQTIADIIEEKNIDQRHPFVVAVNGKAKLRATWADTKIQSTDLVVIWHLPAGGGDDKNPFSIILGIVLVAVGVGIAFFATFTGALAIGLATAAIGVAVLAVGLLGIPDIPSVDQGNQLAKASPTYTLDAQGNRVRIGEAIPVIYGEHRVFPDFASKPYSEFIENEQYLNHLLIIGQGQHDISDIRIGESDINNFAEITYQKVDPGGTITLAGFDSTIRQSDEVSGQLLVGSNNRREGSEGWVGNFEVCPVGRAVNAIHIDIILDRGLYSVDTRNGNLVNRLASWEVQIRPTHFEDGEIITADKLSTATDFNWRTVATESLTLRTVDVTRRTYKYAAPTIRRKSNNSVVKARWQVRVRKTSMDIATGTAGNDAVRWAALKGQMTRQNVLYTNATLLVVRMLATNQLSSQTSRTINLLASRKIRRWNAVAANINSTLVKTSKMEDVLLDLMTDTEYGGGLPLSKIDLPSLRPYPFHATISTLSTPDRLVSFNGVFDRQMSFWEALKLVSRCCRSVPIVQAGVIRIYRDQYRQIPTAMFSSRNMVKDTFKISYSLPTDNQYDGVEVEYIEGEHPSFIETGQIAVDYGKVNSTWRPAFARATHLTKLTTSDSANHNAGSELSISNPAKVRLFGCTDYFQAKLEAIHIARNAFYRRANVSFETELEGYIPSIGDLIVVSHEEFDWGQNGDIIGAVKTAVPNDPDNPDDGTTDQAFLDLSNEVDFESGSSYAIILRDIKGEPIGPITASEVPGNKKRVQIPAELLDITNSEKASAAYYIRVRVNADFHRTTTREGDIYFGSNEERSQFAFGKVNENERYAVIKSISPRGQYRVSIEATLEDDRVYGASRKRATLRPLR